MLIFPCALLVVVLGFIMLTFGSLLCMFRVWEPPVASSRDLPERLAPWTVGAGDSFQHNPGRDGVFDLAACPAQHVSSVIRVECFFVTLEMRNK